MKLQLQTFDTLVQNMAAQLQASASTLLDLTIGSTLRAVIEASASIGLWMQWLSLLVLQTTRAATSNGPDLDTWMGDFSLTRLPATPAVGMVTFSRFTPTQPALLPAGTLVLTADGSQSFAVSIDTTSQAWSTAQNGYVIAAGAPSLSVPVVAVTAGSAGNVQAGTITLLGSALPGIDTVQNAAPMQGGLDAEADAAFRARFQAYINSRSRATPAAVAYAVTSVQQGLDYTIQENVDPTGAPMAGQFVVTVDDGSGAPATPLLAAVQAAIDAVRPVGSFYAVLPPQLLSANVSLIITVAPTANKSLIVGPVAAAITSWINALPIGAPLPYSRLAQIAYDASPTVTNVALAQLNGGSVDITPTQSQRIAAGIVAVN